MKTGRFPDSLVLILAMVVIAQIATLVLPAGAFEREGKSVVPGTYERIEPAESADNFLETDVGRVLWVVPAALLAVPRGLVAGADIIFFVFLVGGVIGVVRRTGAIDALLAATVAKFGRRPLLLIAGTTTVFAIGSSTIGMAEEYMPLVPILVTMCLALGMDAVVALGIVYVGAGVGYGCAALNPFTVLIAQDIAGLEPTSGGAFRWGLLVVCLAVGVHHVARYAARLRADAGRSLVSDVDFDSGFDLPDDVRVTGSRIAVLSVFAAMIALFVWGVKAHGWYLDELAALFLAVGLLAATLARLSPNETAREFCRGAAEMTTTALLIGFARTIEVVLTDGRVIDTVIHGIAQPLEAVGAGGAAVGMLGVQSVFNLFVPSGSGQAFVTMPIMAPLADLTGVTRQTAVLAYQLGDGFMNMLVPTNALLMGMLGLAKIPYQRWLRFVLPLIAKLYVVAIAALLFAVALNYE
ncbi:MAG: TIGR00366 family protein [Planctomycetota bacterium]